MCPKSSGQCEMHSCLHYLPPIKHIEVSDDDNDDSNKYFPPQNMSINKLGNHLSNSLEAYYNPTITNSLTISYSSSSFQHTYKI